MDPSLGRFLSPDSIVPTSTQGTQAWDRYAFVNNNPVRYTDPTGHTLENGKKPPPDNDEDEGDGCEEESCTFTLPEINYDPSKIDVVDLIIDGVGIAADLATIFVPTPDDILWQGIAMAVEIGGAAKTVYDISEGDISALTDITIDDAVNIVKAHPIVAVRLGRAVPVIGILGNLVSIGFNLAQGFE